MFTYIPIIPRLQAFAMNSRVAEQMQYRHKFTCNANIAPSHSIRDVFDSDKYLKLRAEHVRVGNCKLSHKYLNDNRNVALGLSTDGFGPFKRRKHTCWPIILFNYNLPPKIHFHLEYAMALGVVPGPKKPKDMDLFLWPFVREMLHLALGVASFDILSKKMFSLRAYLILVFGDIPAVSMVMRMTGHNGFSPCQMCKITGLRVPDSTGTTHYVPLDCSRHPDVISDPDAIKHYDPENLPLRTHDEMLEQAQHSENASTEAEATRQSRASGIKGPSILFNLCSLRFPLSFPYDFMHLIWENLIKNLILHWTGEFKGLDSGTETYEIPDSVWKALGEATAKSGSTIPSAYGVRVPNLVADGIHMSAEMYSFWTLYLGPVLLRRCFTSRHYYSHFLLLVRLLTICLQFEISLEELEEVRAGFVKWVKQYEQIYYQYSPQRLPVCPLTVHALLHVAPSIKATGPVWCYWAFPMEHYCGAIQPAIRSRRFPFASLARHVLEDAHLTQIKVFYDKIDELSLRPLHQGPVHGSYKDPSYPSCRLLPPKVPERPAISLLTSLVGALCTRFSKRVGIIRNCLKEADIQSWGKVQCIDSDAGDTMQASEVGKTQDDQRDASFVRYEMLIDKHSRRRNVAPEFVLETFYGQLQYIYLIRFNNPCPDLGLAEPTSLIMAQIRECKVNNETIPGLDFHFYCTFGRTDVIDITSVQCVVGRVPYSSSEWGIIDRSGVLGRAVFFDQPDDEDD